jgi:hypothetical protein
MIPKIAQQIITTNAVLQDPEYAGLRIVRAQSNQEMLSKWQANAFEFQQPGSGYTYVRATLSRKGFVDATGRVRLSVMTHPSLKLFTEMVKYDPSSPPADDYLAHDMQEMHEQTQSDFKGQKSTNKDDFKDYILEGVTGDRTLFLPTVSGWQSSKSFDSTVFVAFDEEDPNAMYGVIYLPKDPIMQADGQTQTAALFAVAHTKDAIAAGALDKLIVTLEVELNVDVSGAAQSFADRNGRGTKKNKNLVINFDTSSALSQLRVNSVAGTVFEHRIATGQGNRLGEKGTEYIVDLSTMEQMLLNVVSEGRIKPENFKHHHVKAFLPYAQDFIAMLDRVFSSQWPAVTPANMDPFRKIYVHGWPFALKAIALAFHRAKLDKLGPLSAAISNAKKDAGKTLQETFDEAYASEISKGTKPSVITFSELESRLTKIDWLRYREHWVDITGFKRSPNGSPKRVRLISAGNMEKIVGQAQNTATVISAVAAKICSDSWQDLTKTIDKA